MTSYPLRVVKRTQKPYFDVDAHVAHTHEFNEATVVNYTTLNDKPTNTSI